MAPAPLQIGPIQVWPPLILAPMSGVTNRTMRALYRPFGLGLTVTEFVSSNALMYGSRRTMEMIDQHGLERPVSTQLWGDDPATMALAAKVVRECGADIVDINFGCPAPKVTKTNGGSACLRDPKRCEAIMRAVVAAVDCPVTVKMRLGWSNDALVYLDVARRAQHAGVQAVTLHARTANNSTRGTRIGSTSRASSAPSTSRSSAMAISTILIEPWSACVKAARMPSCSGAQRSVIHGSSRKFEISWRDARRARCPKPSERLRFAIVHYRAMLRELGEARAVPQMRKHLALYLKGISGAAILRERIMHVERGDDAIRVIEETIARLDATPLAA